MSTSDFSKIITTEEELIEDQKNLVVSRYGSSAPGYEEETVKDLGFRVMVEPGLQGRVTYKLNDDANYDATIRIDCIEGETAKMIIFKDLSYDELTDWGRNPSVSNYLVYSKKEQITGFEGKDGKFVPDEK